MVIERSAVAISADNGIYILQTKKGDGFEYRVAHLQAVENYRWDDDKHTDSDDPQIQIKNAREMWGECEVIVDRTSALQVADAMAQKILDDEFCPILEYGISFIKIDAEF